MKSINYLSLFMLLSIATTTLSMNNDGEGQGAYGDHDISANTWQTPVQEKPNKTKQPSDNYQSKGRESKRRKIDSTNN